MRKQQQSSLLPFVAGFLVLVLIIFMGYRHFGKDPLTMRDRIEEAVSEAKRDGSLTPAQQDLLRVQLALIDQISRTGTPPGSLSELVPTYFDSIPKNPDTKKPFYYKRSGKAYIIRSSEEQGEFAVASLRGDGLQKIAPVSDKDFVNPNTMQIEEFVYDPSGKRDPFRPFDLSPKLDKNSGLSPLEQYAIGQLRLTAVLSFSADEVTAIVEDAGGKGYTVRKGTKIGNAGGVVVSIERDRLKVLETQIDLTGASKQTVIEMTIETADNEKGKKKKKK